MYKNYFILKRIVSELNNKYSDALLTSAFTQEKDRLVFTLINSREEEKALIVSINPSESFIMYRNEYKRANRNTISHFESHLPDKIVSFSIADDDRIIRINLLKSTIYILFRGKYSNILIIKNKECLAFKKYEDNQILFDLINELKIKTWNKGNTDYLINENLNFNDFKEVIRAKHPVINKDILQEIEYRYKPEFILNDTIITILEEIKNNNTVIFKDGENIKLTMCSFGIVNTVSEIIKSNQDILSSINDYLLIKWRFEKTRSNNKIIERKLYKEIAYYSNTLKKLKIRIDTGCKDQEYKYIADLLLANISRIKKGMTNISVLDYYTNTETEIKLNPKFDHKSNVDYYYSKSRSEKINFSKSVEIYETTKKKLEITNEIKLRYELIKHDGDLSVFMKELNLTDKKQTEEKVNIKDKFRCFTIDNFYKVFVGKDSINNDLLTMRFAKPNDYWFHAKGCSGSHVILRNDNTKEKVPKRILEQVASIAAFYCKAKTSKYVPVICTFKKFVSKHKGMNPGQVTVSREEMSLLVEPILPTKEDISDK